MSVLVVHGHGRVAKLMREVNITLDRHKRNSATAESEQEQEHSKPCDGCLVVGSDSDMPGASNKDQFNGF